VRTGGAAALEKVLKDAVDILERKIQLLERRGWFEGIEHRREALDRLLPTLRATSDPIMRELYLGLVSERTGVSREVLEKEAKAPPAASPEAPGAGPSEEGAVRQAGHSPPPAAPKRVPVGTSAERTLVTLFLADPMWLDRARREVPISWFEPPCWTAPTRPISPSGSRRTASWRGSGCGRTPPRSAWTRTGPTRTPRRSLRRGRCSASIRR
jgi:DNA primase